MIELKEVTKEYSKGIAALNGVNIKIEQGEFVFIVGDSEFESSVRGMSVSLESSDSSAMTSV